MSNRNRKIVSKDKEESQSFKPVIVALCVSAWILTCLIFYGIIYATNERAIEEAKQNEVSATVAPIENPYDQVTEYPKWLAYDEFGLEVTAIMEFGTTNNVIRYMIVLTDKSEYWLYWDLTTNETTWERFVDPNTQEEEETSND